MNKIRVHNPCNSYTKHNRFYNDFWDEFTIHLKKYFMVEENRQYEFAHSTRFRVNYRYGTTQGYEILECEYAIENLQNGEIVMMSVSDNITSGAINERHNPKFKKVLISQYLLSEIEAHVGEYLYKYHPWTYFQALNFDLEPYYLKRLLEDPIDDRLYFRGTSIDDRTILEHIDKNLITPYHRTIDMPSYFNEMIKHKIALSVDGRGEFCYRDIECFAVGVPIIRFEYVSKMHDPLIPNYHYISIPRPIDMKLYRLGNENHAKMLIERYYEVLNNKDFLKYIVENARKYYLKNCTMPNIIKNTHELLNLDSWL